LKQLFQKLKQLDFGIGRDLTNNAFPDFSGALGTIPAAWIKASSAANNDDVEVTYKMSMRQSFPGLRHDPSRQRA
jgi:hypothetical protein